MVRVADQNQCDLTAGVAHDRLHMLRMIFRTGIENHCPLLGIDQIRVGSEIGHRAGIVRHDAADARHDRQIDAAFRLGFGQEGHLDPRSSLEKVMPQSNTAGNREARVAGSDQPVQEETAMAKGLLFASFDNSPAQEDEFNDWYDLEHVPERMRVPGFLNAQRWVGEENPRLVAATYDLESHAVMNS